MPEDWKDKIATSLSDIFFEPHLEPRRKEDAPNQNFTNRRQVKRWIVMAHNIGILLGVLSALLIGIFGTNKISELWESKGTADKTVIDRVDDFRLQMSGLPGEIESLQSDIGALQKTVDDIASKQIKLNAKMDSIMRDQAKSATISEIDYQALLAGLGQISSDIQTKLKKR